MDQNAKIINTVNMTRADEVEIDLLEVARVLWRKAWLLILAFVIGAGIVGAGTKFLVTPQYRASSTIYILSKSTSVTSLADIQIGNNLTGDFRYFATTRETLNEVIAELVLNTTYADLNKQVNVTNPSESHMLRVQVTDPDPQMAAQISNTLAEVLREQIADIMNTDKPSMVERAIPPARPSSPSLFRNAVLGGIILAALVAVIVLIRYFADDTITTEEDVRRYLNVTVLAAVPFERNVASARK